MSGPDHFARFGLPAAYDVDLADLAARYRAAQRQVHPDRHARAEPVRQHLAERLAADLNEAYAVLRSPLARAEYLLALADASARQAGPTIDDAALLEEQMALRERLAAARSAADPAALDRLQGEVDALYRAQQQVFADAFARGEMARAGGAVTAMQFQAKLLREIQDLAAVLEDL